MRKSYIFLLFAVLLRWSALGQDDCQLTFLCTDRYNDGWEGSTLSVIQNDALVGTVSCPVGSSGSEVQVSVSADWPVYVVFHRGQWPDEMGGTVADGSGAVVFTIENMGSYNNGDTILVLPHPCPTCLQPSGLRVEDQLPNSVTIAWDADPGHYAWFVRLDNGDTVMEYGTSHTFENLQPHTRHTAYVAAYCYGDTSRYVPFEFATACPEDGCDVRIIMHDSYCDGWTGNHIDGILDGTAVFSATIASGCDDTLVLDYCSGEELTLIWHKGYFANEATFTVMAGDTPRVNASGSDYQDGDTIFVVHTCPNCIAPEALVVDNITGSTADISWTPLGNAVIWSVTVGGGSAYQTVYVTEPHYTATGLTSYADYSVVVRSICYDGDSSIALCGEFHTAMCDDGAVMQNFDPESTSYYQSIYPIGCSSYCNSMVQMIVDADNLLVGPSLMAMAFNTRNGDGGNMFNNVDVYLSNVSNERLYGSFLLPDENRVFVHVIANANLGYSSGGWHVFYFDNLFTWDGASNLLVTVVRNNGEWEGGGQFSAHHHSPGKSCRAMSDTYTFDIHTQPMLEMILEDSIMGDLVFYGCEPGTWCEPPVVTDTVADTHSVTVYYSGNAAVHEVAIMPGEWNPPTAGILTEADTHTFEGLDDGTLYSVGVRDHCADGLPSDWTVVTISTIEDTTSHPVTAIDDYNPDTDNVTLAPNPTTGKVAVGGLEGVSIVEILDISGRIAARYNTSEPCLTADLHTLPAGTYFVRITCSRFSTTKKLIKQ